MKIKGNKKDMEKTEKLFECRRALDCKKTPCSPVGTGVCLVYMDEEPYQTSPSRTLPFSLGTGLLWSGAGHDHGALAFCEGLSQTILRAS